MENKNFETMTVSALREESRKRGLKLEHKGHKFTKAELIERINKYDLEQKDIEEDIQKAIDEAGEQPEQEQKSQMPDGYISFAETLEQIVTKYSGRKKQEIYDNELQVGSFVVFVHYVEAANGKIYKKLRTAKVVGINRKKELVRVQTILGTEKELSFDDLLYIRGNGEHCTYPRDIKTYLKKQRTEKGRELMYEKFRESEGAN